MPLVFHLGNSQVSVYRTIGPTLVFYVSVGDTILIWVLELWSNVKPKY